MRVHGALALAALTAGCIDERPLGLPDLGGAQAIIVVVTSGAVKEAVAVDLSTGRTPDLPLAVHDRDATELFVLAYDQPLASLRLAPGPIALAEPTACGRDLPAPARAWRTSLAAEQGAKVWFVASELPELRKAPRRGPCPSPATTDPVPVDARCTASVCLARAVESDCELHIDAAACGLGTLTGTIDADGDVCLQPTELLGACASTEPLPGATRGVSCEGSSAIPKGCSFDVYARERKAPFTSTRAALWPAEPFTPQVLGSPPGGWLVDLAVRDGRLAIAAFDHELGTWSCGTSGPGVLFFADPETLAVTSTAALAPCPSGIAADPTSDGFLALGGGAQPELARLDRTGRTVGRVVWSGAATSGSYRALSLVVLEGSPPLAVAALSRPDLSLGSQLFVVDLARFVERPTSGRPGDRVLGLGPYMGAEVLAVDDFRDAIELVDVTDGAITAGTDLKAGFMHVGLGQPLWHAATRRILVSALWPTAGVLAFDPAFGALGHAWPYERDVEVWALATWPSDPRLVLAGMTEFSGDRSAVLGLVDPSVPRLLPGAEVVGHGAIGRLRPDPRGRVFAVMPWTAEVLRVTPTN